MPQILGFIYWHIAYRLNLVKIVDKIGRFFLHKMDDRQAMDSRISGEAG